MEVVVPVQDFHFDSTTSSPYVSAPSSPKSFSNHHPFDYYYYTSAPTSPTRAAAILSQSSSIPFNWEEKPGTPKSRSASAADDDFTFDFSGQLDKGGLPPPLTAADELFHKGKIRPLKPPPRLYNPAFDDWSKIASSPKSPKSPNKGLKSTRHRGVGGEFDPFAAAMVEATRDRGISSSRSRKGSRSLSPIRFQENPNQNSSPPPSASSSAAKSGGGSKKWRLRDLFLFRSASEGRATGNRSKDPLRKYTILASSPPSASLRSRGDDSRNSSFRSTDSGGSTRRGRGGGAAVSAHEMHYTSNRAASEELKKKTPLPYRQSLFGCLRFNPAFHSIARGFNGC